MKIFLTNSLIQLSEIFLLMDMLDEDELLNQSIILFLKNLSNEKNIGQ